MIRIDVRTVQLNLLQQLKQPTDIEVEVPSELLDGGVSLRRLCSHY